MPWTTASSGSFILSESHGSAIHNILFCQSGRRTPILFDPLLFPGLKYIDGISFPSHSKIITYIFYGGIPCCRAVNIWSRLTHEIFCSLR